jgi:hypothetical protein
LDALPAPYAKFVAASTCDAIKAAWPEIGLLNAPSCVAACRGNVAIIECGTPKVNPTPADLLVVRAADCDYYGSTCAVIPGAGAGCSDASTPLACGKCSPAGSLVLCDQGHPLAFRCSAAGLSCNTSSSGSASCTAGPCTAHSCNGDTAAVCVSGTSVVQQCARVGQTCRATGGCGDARTTAACQQSGFAEVCDGTTAVFCSGGNVHYADCQKLGYSGCSTASGEARCR